MRPVHTTTCSATSLASFPHRWCCVCPVNNSAFTLAIAAESIAAAGRVLQLLGTPPDPAHGNWSALSNRGRLNIPFNTTLRYHPEFEGYAQGTTINQADTQFMQYPLQFPMPADVAANDMSLYDQALANHGPSMTWPFFAASYLQLASRPELASQRPMYLAKAAAEFEKSYNYFLPRFYSFVETANCGPKWEGHGSGGMCTPHFTSKIVILSRFACCPSR